MSRADPKADADRYFEQGRALLEKGLFTAAGEKFAASHELDPADGTLLNLAICHEAEGKLAVAWGEYQKVLVSARRNGNVERERSAQTRLDVLSTKLHTLVLSVPKDLPPSARIAIDDQPVPREQWGLPAPVTTGMHQLRATCPGKKSWAAPLDVSGKPQRYVVPVVLDDEPTAPPLATAQATPPPTKPATPDQGPRPSSNSTRGWTALGVGVAALSVGTYYGLRATFAWQERNDNCPEGRCNQTAVDAADRTKSSALMANIAIPLGLVLSGVGAYWLLTEPASPTLRGKSDAGSWRASPTIGSQSVGVTVQGVLF